MELVCVWKNGSSHIDTEKPQPPELCRKKGCTGVFTNARPLCESFKKAQPLAPGGHALAGVKKS